MIAISTFGDPQSVVLPVIERIYPKASELSEILNYNPCPECTEVFHNTPNLEMHLQKSHGRVATPKENNNTNVIKQFYCPEEGCKYSGHFKTDLTGRFKKDFGFKYFTQHKYLKQHYIKVHMEKKFVCEQCGKRFATTSLHKHHLTQECGLKFVCSCGVEYNTVQALLNHARRKMHKFVKSWPAARPRKNEQNNAQTVQRPPVIPILPKPYDTMVANTTNALSELRCQKSIDIGVQTEPTAGQRRRRNVKSSDTSRQTQTSEKRTRISSETQTVGEYCNKTKKSTNRRRKKSMETQTKVVEHTVTSGELEKTPAPVVKQEYSVGKDIGLPDLWQCFNSEPKEESLFGNALPELTDPLFEEPKLNQDSLFPEINSDSTDQFLSAFLDKNDLDSKLCSIETQTEFSVESLFETFDTFNNIETQTTTELWDQYSNTCTQTCDDILLAFSDIQTQTIWPETSAGENTDPAKL